VFADVGEHNCLCCSFNTPTHHTSSWQDARQTG
jgi:hypothetical protein